MKKRIWSKAVSIFTAILLVVGIVPNTTITALAAVGAPSQLYVGNKQVISGSDNATYWTTDTDGNLTQSAADQSWNVKYDPATVTLTLRGATIQGGTNTGPAPFGSGIYAQCSIGQSVTLTIKLIGENTITGYYGIYVNAEISADSNGTDASLTITGENNGSLEVSGSNHGIFVKSGTGNASVTIENASVDAKTTQTNSGYAGVYVHSSAIATNSPQLSLAVNGGSLTTSASEGNDGIQFYVGAYEATSATTSLTVNDNAIVDARTGGISASGVSVNPNVDIGSTDSTSGIVFDGTEGTVYGDVTLDESLTINQGETLTIPEGSTLNSNGNLTNNGTILASGGTLEGTLSNGTRPTTPNITEQPYDDTVTEGEDATFTVEASAGSETLTYQWQQSTDNGSSWTNIESGTSASYTINSTNTSMNGYQYRCVVTGSGGVSVISQTATLTVQAKPASVPVTGVKLNKDSLTLQERGSDTLMLNAKLNDK
ncbi:immunoglobulin domain-containing protein [Massilimicrobiota timonensis]|uniref:immunoglobulin domain-containing protein n=1 Tax=Massilimicrobiota timonensis TaxID=1776392 RepID=UPI00101DF021|nr:immunoglobulin domain-containing protein [Massilimicrobiota timonensis]